MNFKTFINKTKMRFHILVNPFVPTAKGGKYNCDAFNVFAKRLAVMLSKDYPVFFYGTSEDPFDSCHRIKHFQIMKEEEYNDLSVNRGVYLCHADDKETKNKKDDLACRYNLGAKITVEQNCENGDFVLYSYIGNRELQNNINLIHVMPNNMGSRLIFTPYNIFPSSSWAHWMISNYMVVNNIQTHLDLECWSIVPPMFDRGDFQYNQIKQPNTILYLGRLQACKGILTVLFLAAQFPEKTFWIAGDAIDSPIGTITIQDTKQVLSITENVKILGYQNTEQRAKLLSDASCLIQPSPYPEPFGFNVIEAYISGTPVITTDFGTFTETVIEGVTGFKCRTTLDYYHAIEYIFSIKPLRCYQEGMAYISKKLRPRYVRAFEMFQEHWKRTKSS